MWANRTRKEGSTMSASLKYLRILGAITLASGSLYLALSSAKAAGASLDPGTSAAVAADPYKEITWADLIPKDWNPAKFAPGRRLGIMSDLDPDAQIAFAQMRLAFDNAPTVAGMDGTQVKLPGYVVPLDEVRGELKEFLLVPYFGACIHTPPPPANQIVFVRLKTPTPGFHAMDTVWVRGQLATTRQASYMGASGYRIDAVSVERYVPPSR
jgi:hypothetical protein